MQKLLKSIISLFVLVGLCAAQTQQVPITIQIPQGTLTFNGQWTPATTTIVTPPPVTTAKVYTAGSKLPLPFKVGVDTSFGNNRLFSPDDLWYRDISNDPLDTSIPTPYGAPQINPATSQPYNPQYQHQPLFNLNYGTNSFAALPGIPYNIVDSSIAGFKFTAVTFTDSWADAEGDNVLMPLAPWMLVEGQTIAGTTQTAGDNHIIILDNATGIEYECGGFYWKDPAGKVTDPVCGTLAIWDVLLPSSEQRPYSFTSANAAGTNILIGSVRPDEMVAGVIDHAMRATGRTNATIFRPASHQAANSQGDVWNTGQKLRLSNTVNFSSAGKQTQTVMTAAQKYGFAVDDNGGWYTTFAGLNSDYDMNDLGWIGTKANLTTGQLLMLADPNGGKPLDVPTPVINSFTGVKGSGTLSWSCTATNGTSYIVGQPFTRANTLSGLAAGTYTLRCQNANIRLEQQVTI